MPIYYVAFLAALLTYLKEYAPLLAPRRLVSGTFLSVNFFLRTDTHGQIKKPTDSKAFYKIAIVTTAAVHLKNQKPFDMHDPPGDPTYREIPKDTSKEELIITHDYYDHKDADKDINVVFPIDRLKELKETGEIKDIAEINFGLMGHIDGGHIYTLINETAPEIAEKLRQQGVDAVLLTPG